MTEHPDHEGMARSAADAERYARSRAVAAPDEYANDSDAFAVILSGAWFYVVTTAQLAAAVFDGRDFTPITLHPRR